MDTILDISPADECRAEGTPASTPDTSSHGNTAPIILDAKCSTSLLSPHGRQGCESSSNERARRAGP